ncbi:MAG: helix-turn-helix transcriptional regulator [Planococcus sp. (in: firmicutes)]|uniref:helix-turn-helix domain-containing protein n=1 Tax=Planococcus halocryophilus TaxID=1215089 RepID=UPI001F10E67C|nr:helix-turn-helix transcriptional regulator [Planococcus halocryophilus]MCH4826312.1 helix-turn-helix transcriptional regulator [Planococcus halocryophilus]
MTKLTENLKSLRLQNKLSHQLVAEHLKITKVIYGRFELGTTEPSLKLLVKLADLYSISLDELVGREFAADGQLINQLLMKKELKKEMTKEINSLVKQLGNQFIQSKEADIVKRVKQKFNLN